MYTIWQLLPSLITDRVPDVPHAASAIKRRAESAGLPEPASASDLLISQTSIGDERQGSANSDSPT